MLLRFIGQYTGGRGSITLEGVTFTGRDASEVDADSRLVRHPEFEAVEALAAPIEAMPAKPRGRPRKCP